jgi:transcriptional regulator with XRE-family HTH domain
VLLLREIQEAEMINNTNENVTGLEKVDQLNERLRKARKFLNLSQEFVAKKTGLNRTSITAIELGQRNVSVEELRQFSEIYGIPVEDLVNGEKVNSGEKVLARLFSELSEIDKLEIQNLIEFKVRLRKSLNESIQN